MYEELVKSLRNCVADENGCCFRCPEDCNGPCQENLMTKAADAIEELQATLCNWCAVCPYEKRDIATCEIYESCRAKPPKEET